MEDRPIKCEDCEEESPASEWKRGSVFCEVCGDHDGFICPRCGYPIDALYMEKRRDDLHALNELAKK